MSSAVTVPSFRQYVVLTLNPVATVHSLGLSHNHKLLSHAEKLPIHKYVGYVHKMTHVDPQCASFEVLLLSSSAAASSSSSIANAHIIPINTRLPDAPERAPVLLSHRLPWQQSFHPSYALAHVQAPLTHTAMSCKGKAAVTELPVSSKLPLLLTLNDDLDELPGLPCPYPNVHEAAYTLALEGSDITPCVTVSSDLTSAKELRDPIHFFEDKLALLRLIAQHAPKFHLSSKYHLSSCYKPPAIDRRHSSDSQKSTSSNKLREWTSHLLGAHGHLELQRV